MDDSNFFGVEQKIILFAGVFFASNGVVEIGAFFCRKKLFHCVEKKDGANVRLLNLCKRLILTKKRLSAQVFHIDTQCVWCSYLYLQHVFVEIF